MAGNERTTGSAFYNSVIKELSMIVNNEHITSHTNPILSLEIKLYYVKKNSNYNFEQKDEIMKRMIIEKTRGLEYTVSGLVKEYADVYQRVYQKYPDLHYTYIKILKKVKFTAQQEYGEKLLIVRTFYYRYLEWMNWTENLQAMRTEAVKKLRTSYAR